MNSRILALAAILVGVSSSASAISTGIGYSSDPLARFTRVGFAISGTSTLDGYSRRIPVGLLGYHTLDPNTGAQGDFWGICAQFEQPVNTAYLPYGLGTTATGSPGLQHAGNIVESYLGGVTNSAMAAGLQLAVWEALYDGSFDLSSGHFTTSSFGDVGTVGSAAYYAAQYFGASSGTAIYVGFQPGPTGQITLTSNSQPIVPGAVPGPAAALPFALMAIKRRRTVRK